MELSPLILILDRKSREMGLVPQLSQPLGREWLRSQLESFRQLGGREVFIWGKTSSELWNSLENDPSISCFQWHFLEGAFGDQAHFSQKGAYVLPLSIPSPKTEVWQTLTLWKGGLYWICLPDYQGLGGHPLYLAPEAFGEKSLMKGVSPEDFPGVKLWHQAPARTLKFAVSDQMLAQGVRSLLELQAFCL